MVSNILDRNCKIFIFETIQGHTLGQVRLEYLNEKWLIDYNIDRFLRGLGLGEKAIAKSLSLFNKGVFWAKVKKTNKASIKIFQNLGFKIDSEKNEFNNFKFNN